MVNMKWTREPVNLYENEIRRFAGLSGLKGEGLETIVKLNFVHGFPENISMELQQIENIEKLLIIVQRIRVCSLQIFNKDFFGPIFFALCPQ